MADTYSDRLGLIGIEEGTHSNEWGDLLNLNFQRLDSSVRGYTKIVLAGAESLDSNDITTTASTAQEESFFQFIEFTGTAGTVTVPAENIMWIVYNNTGSNFTFQPAGGTGVTLTNGKVHFIVYGSNGTTFTDVTSLIDGGNADTITVVDEAADATCFPLFVTAATGSLESKSNTGLTFDSSTGVLTATGLAGPLTGNATTATTAGTVTTAAQPTITSVGTLTSFASTGIDDNATGERLQLADGQLTLGTTNNFFTITKPDELDKLIISGGSTGSTGGAIELYGTSDASAGDVRFASSSLYFMAWDESLGVLTFYTATGSKSTALTLDASQNTIFAGKVIGSAGNEIDSGLFAIKGSDTSRDSGGTGDTLTDDPDLQITLAANAYYELNWWIEFTSTSGTPDVKYWWEEVDGSWKASIKSMLGTSGGSYNGMSEAFVSSPLIQAIPVNEIVAVDAKMLVKTGGAGGLFKLQWAQNTADATATTCLTGSWVKATKLA